MMLGPWIADFHKMVVPVDDLVNGDLADGWVALKDCALVVETLRLGTWFLASRDVPPWPVERPSSWSTYTWDLVCWTRM